MEKIRLLRADEIDCRPQTVKAGGCSLLLYKDARCDMTILDEIYGSLNWKREHTRDNHNCIVSVWNSDIQQWISKEDTGIESSSPDSAAKGLASDSFKRACVNFGIGRELYTAPFIWIKLSPGETYTDSKGRIQLAVGLKFFVKKIEYKDRVITGLTISDGKTDRFTMHGTDYTQQKPTDFSAAEKKLAEAKTQDELVAAWTSLSGAEKIHCETLKDLRKGELAKS